MGVKIWGWDSVNLTWRPVAVTAAGALVIMAA